MPCYCPLSSLIPSLLVLSRLSIALFLSLRRGFFPNALGILLISLVVGVLLDLFVNASARYIVGMCIIEHEVDASIDHRYPSLMNTEQWSMLT